MNISKKSWHYKLVTNSVFIPSKSLCSYFWQVFLVLAFYVLVTGIPLGFLAIVAYFPGYDLLAAMGLVEKGNHAALAWYFKPLVSVVGLLCFSIILGVAVLVLYYPLIGVLFILQWVKRMLEVKLNLSESKEKDPKTLVGKFIKAKKEKVCPVINFVEEKE